MNSSIQDEFIATVSHELRTPLTSIRGFSQTLLNSWDKIDEENKKKFVKIIEEQSNRLINLVENVLTVSKINKTEVLKKIDVNQAITKIVTIFAEQHKARKIEVNPKDDLPPARLDEDKFQQIMTNLIDNALKYSDKEIVVSTQSADNCIFIKVRDKGVGIKSEDREKVFKKFSRLENHLTSTTQGNGLGLYITKGLVESMCGSIDFESKEGEGTTFVVKFPIYNQEEALKCSRMS